MPAVSSAGVNQTKFSKLGGEELVERDGLEVDDDAATHAGAGVVDGGVGEEAGVEEVLGGVAERVLGEELAGFEAGDGEELGGGVGAPGS